MSKKLEADLRAAQARLQALMDAAKTPEVSDGLS
jgi:hypothetical protein